MKNAELERLEATIAQATKDLADMKAKLERDARPELNRGQLWEKDCGSIYLGCALSGSSRTDLICIASTGMARVGNYWCEGHGFDGDDETFTYLGMASDLLTVKASA